jgi:hypothetical protein
MQFSDGRGDGVVGVRRVVSRLGSGKLLLRLPGHRAENNPCVPIPCTRSAADAPRAFRWRDKDIGSS